MGDRGSQGERGGDNDPQLAALGDAIADGEWPVSPAGSPGAPELGGPAHPLLPELDAIARLAHAHRASSTLSDDRAGSLDSSESLGEAMSRSAFAPLTTRPDLTGARRWGPLFVLDRIGGGSFGQVYRAWDPALEREVALKLLRLPAESRSTAHAVVREGQLLASVHHPNVISVYGAAAIDGEVGIWMELVRGRTLEQIVLEEGPMSAQEATVIGDALCGALAAVHQRGLLHRDIKAANVMREAGGRIVLLDFGTGVEASTGTEGPRRPAGTPLYMAPELLLDTAPASVQSDIYSLGVLMFFLVTGSFPVYAKTLREVQALHRAGRTLALSDVRPDLPLEFLRALDQALSPRAERRHASASALRTRLVPDASHAASTWPSLFGLLTVLSLVVAAGLTVVGAVTTRYFNVTLGRTEYVTEGLWEWFTWGVTASFAPAVLLLLAVLIFSLCAAALRILARSWPGAERALVAAASWLRRRRLSDPTTLAAMALMVSLLAVGLAAWAFRETIGGLTTLSPDLSTTAQEHLSVLARDQTATRQAYRKAFIWATVIAAFTWYPVLRASWRRNEPLNYALLAGGAAVIALAVLLLQFPYRLFVHSEFEPATWRGATCYVLGERGDTLLLFCPSLDRPRNREVARGDRALQRHGGKFNLFYDLENHP